MNKKAFIKLSEINADSPDTPFVLWLDVYSIIAIQPHEYHSTILVTGGHYFLVEESFETIQDKCSKVP